MTEPIGTGGLVETETALQREVDVLAERFPKVDRGDVDRLVRDTFAQLKPDAEVVSHLIAVTSTGDREAAREGRRNPRPQRHDGSVA
jgi:hypothetical protein